MWGTSRVYLGLTTEEFWLLTLREISDLVDVRNEIRKREHYAPAALIALVLAEINRNREEHPEPFQLQDFMLQEAWESEPADPVDENEKLLHKLRALTHHFGGVDETKGAKLEMRR